MAARKKRTPSAAGDGWVAIAADAAARAPGAPGTPGAPGSGAEPAFVTLRNPATDAACLYMLGADQQLYEVKAFQEDFRSWFVGQTVQRDGRLLFITLMDPLYLIMPYLIKSGKDGKFQPLDQLLVDDDFPACSRLLGCTRSLASLHHLAEEKEVGGLKFHRYSQEKTLRWLEKKVQRTVAALRRMSVSVGAGLKSNTYIRVKAESAPEEDFLRYAHGLVSEYVSGELSAALLTHLQLPELQSPHEAAPPCKKRKLSDKPVEAGDDYSKFNSADFARRPPKKMTTAQKTLAKVDKTGMKPLSSFFSPKVKAEK